MKKRIGRWRVEAELGSGGMGSVHLARRRGQRAAVKTIHPSLAADPSFRRRFEREIELLTRLRGPYVAEFVDADASAREPWLASQFIEGPTLAQEIAQHGPLTDEQVIALAFALAHALAGIHAGGIVHRDLKPTNVILASAHPVIIDFGIAAADDSTSLTRTGVVLGSAGWMAPEQLRGDDAGPAADIFSWAGLVTFAASGSAPFGAGRPEAAGHRVLHDQPNLESIPTALRPVLEMAFEKDPADRPSAEDLMRFLEPQLATAPTVVEGVTQLWSGPGSSTFGTPQKAVATSRGTNLVWRGLAAVVLVLVGTLTALWYLTDLGSDPPAKSVEVTEPAVESEAAPPRHETTTTSTLPTTTMTTVPTTIATTTTTAPPPETTSTTPGVDRFPMELPPDGRPIEVSVGHTRVGDCLTSPTQSFPMTVSESVIRVPCGQEHLMETMGHVRFNGDESESTRYEQTEAACRRKFDEYVGVPLGVEWTAFTLVVPIGVEWEHGWRESICLVVGTEGIPMTGTKYRLRE